jgi:hypothetical protein
MNETECDSNVARQLAPPSHGEHCALTARLEGRAPAKKAAANSSPARNFSQLDYRASTLVSAGIAARSLTAAKEKF